MQTSEPFTTARLGKPPADRLVEHALRFHLEYTRHNFEEHCHVDEAHTIMLIEEGILSKEQGGKILAQLAEIERLGPDRFPMDPKFNTFLLQVEKYMIDRIGEDTAGRMHTGRSQIDRDAAVERLHSRNRLLLVIKHLVALEATMLSLAGRHVETLMPGYTHLQHAQPWTFGHYLLRFFDVFERDLQRLEGAFARTNRSSLGGAALAGTSWPLNRERTAELLGHDGLVLNAHDAGCFSPDFSMENAAMLSILVSNLGHLAADLYVWHSWEFGFVELDDGYCGSSSIMPQKKNPDAFEMILGWAGQAIGWLPTALGPLKAATSTDCAAYFAGDIIHPASDIAWRATDLMQGALESMTVHTERMRERTAVCWSTATNLADILVRRCDLSFRTAHHVVGRLVRLSMEGNVLPDRVTAELLNRAAVETIGRPLNLSQDVVSQALDPVQFIQSRVTRGSVHPHEVREMITEAERKLALHQNWYSSTKNQIDAARQGLESAVASGARHA